MTNEQFYTAFIALLALTVSGYMLFSSSTPLGGATPGTDATVATTSNPTVGTSAALVFATSTCAARSITTYASPVMITFSDNQGSIPTALFGTLQGASSTVVYDGEQYGCDAVRIYSFASQAITVVESR